MKQIRQDTFETNSSSSHSITISNKGHFDANALPIVEYYKGAKNCVVLTGGEFGWGYEEFDDALTKANYLATFVEQLSLQLKNSQSVIWTDIEKCLSIVSRMLLVVRK